MTAFFLAASGARLRDRRDRAFISRRKGYGGVAA